NGECRGYVGSRLLNFDDASKIAVETCDRIEGKPVIIHDNEHQTYWKGRISSDGLMVLAIVCNTATKEWVWTDGSPIDFIPTEGFTEDLISQCSTGNNWFMNEGHWTKVKSGTSVNGYFFRAARCRR
ncbi:hypothetical protein PMAYCL1PPCAC_21719, partial [Pristionchus mayeri]